ncbi:MAG TPA: hypothetical protein VK786_05995, partial [bacterium]|nr:hypothetical protein [bacterium]
ARGGRVVHNNLYNAGLLTKDVGAIYSYRADGDGMRIAYNHVHNVASVRGVGIYLDNGDSDYVVDHNLVQDCAWAAIELNLPSVCNAICNNTLVGCRHWVWADGAPHSMIGTVLANNLYTGTDLLTSHHWAPCLAANRACLKPGTVFAPGGFTLLPGSPAIAAGLALPPFTDGRCSQVPDLGAFEYGCGPAWTSGATLKPKAFPYPTSFFKHAITPKARGAADFLDPQMGARPEPRRLNPGGTQWS